MKIIITNNIALNGGDAAILLGMIKALKLRFGQDTDFVVTGTYPEVCSQLYPDIKWRSVIGREADTTPYNHIRIIGRIARLLKRYRFYTAAFLRRNNISFYRLLLNRDDAETLSDYATSDYIISSGGTYLIEPYGITPQYIDYKISVILRKPLIQYTQSMGPFTNKQTRHRLRWVFNHCQNILLRDLQSAKNVNELNIADSSIIHVVPDAAFALGNIDIIREREKDNVHKYGNVAISVRDWMHCSDNNTMINYRKCIASVVERLVKDGYYVYFISTCQEISSYTNDNNVADDIIKLVPIEYHNNIIRYNRYLSIQEITDLLKQVDFIIATRLHMSILALISGVPVYPIAYEFKTIELYKSLGYEKVNTLDNLEISELYNSITDFVNSFSYERRQEVNNQVEQFIRDSLAVPNLIK